MKRSKTARLMSIEELKAIVWTPTDKPLIERLVWMDARATAKVPRTILPCFVTDILEGENGEVDGVHLALVQWMRGVPNIILVGIKKTDIVEPGALAPGKGKCRFWNKPPKEDILESYPFDDPEEELIKKFEEQLEMNFDEAEAKAETEEG